MMAALLSRAYTHVLKSFFYILLHISLSYMYRYRLFLLSRLDDSRAILLSGTQPCSVWFNKFDYELRAFISLNHIVVSMRIYGEKNKQCQHQFSCDDDSSVFVHYNE